MPKTFEDLCDYISFPSDYVVELYETSSGVMSFCRAQNLRHIIEYVYYNHPEKLNNLHIKGLIPTYCAGFCAAAEAYSEWDEATDEAMIQFGKRCSSRQYWDEAIPHGYDPLTYLLGMFPEDELFFDCLYRAFQELDVYLTMDKSHEQFTVGWDVGDYSMMTVQYSIDLDPEMSEEDQVLYVMQRMRDAGLGILL